MSGVPREDSGVLLAHQRHAPSARLRRVDERLDVRRRADHHSTLHRLEDPDHLEQLVAPRGEHGQRPGPLEWRLIGGQVRAQPGQVVAQPDPILVIERAVRLDLPRRAVDQRVDLRVAGLRDRELLGIEVKIETHQPVSGPALHEAPDDWINAHPVLYIPPALTPSRRGRR